MMHTDHYERSRDATGAIRLDMGSQTSFSAQADVRSLSCHPSAGRFGMTIT